MSNPKLWPRQLSRIQLLGFLCKPEQRWRWFEMLMGNQVYVYKSMLTVRDGVLLLGITTVVYW